jgi:hypothetical protein
MTEKTTKKAWMGWVVRLVGTAVVLALLFYVLPFQELWRTLRRISLPVWLLVLAGYALSHLMAMIKWRLMVNLAGAGLNHLQAARCYFAGLFGNLFLPSLVGGDVIRAGLALKLGKSKAGVLLGSLLDRMLDIAALASVALLGALLIPGHLDPQVATTFRTILAVLALGGVAGLGVLWFVLRRRFSFRIRRKLVRVRTAARKMARQPARVLIAWTLALSFQVSLVLLMTRIAAECGLHVPLSAWLFAYPMAKLVAMVPVTQGGIGVREAALAALLVPFGARPVLTVAAGLVWETVIYAVGLAGGIIPLLAGRRSST